MYAHVIIAVVIIIVCLYVVETYYAPDTKLVYRIDGTFVPFPPPPAQELSAFYTKHNLKPIQLLFRTETPFQIHVHIGAARHTLTVPSNYVTDGVSKPIRGLPIPHEYEDSYWVYHDYMYQHQQFDDGTRITKRQADDIMHLIIKQNPNAPLWCRLYRMFVNYNNYNADYWNALNKRGPCFYVRHFCYFPKCNAGVLMLQA